ncbi:MAG: hypothetical protein ACRDI2_08140, partial [Chloroflexota bacterium]
MRRPPALPQALPRADWLALLCIAAATVLLVPQTVLLGKLPDHFDYWLQEYIHLAFLHRWLRAGELPLWNGQLVAGTPHLADPQAAVLYPLTTLPLLVLPPEVVARLSIPLHFFLAGAFTYGYARRLDQSRPAALAAGLAYALAPHFAPLEVATYLQQSAAWTPAILWALQAGFETRHPSRFAIAGLLWALQLLRGYPQTWYITGLFAAAYSLFHLGTALLRQPGQLLAAVVAPIFQIRHDVGQRSPSPCRRGGWEVRSIIAGPLLFVVGLAAGAAQLLPSLELLANSQRSGGFSLAEASGPGRITLANQLGVAGPDAEVSGAFPGGVALGLALAATLYARGPHVWFYLGAAAVSLALCLGDRTPLWALAYRAIPGFATLHMPHRTLFLWSLSLATLAGFGLDTLRRRPPLRPLIVAAGAIAGLTWLAAATVPGVPAGASRGALQLTLGLAVLVIAVAPVRRAPSPHPPSPSTLVGEGEGEHYRGRVSFPSPQALARAEGLGVRASRPTPLVGEGLGVRFALIAALVGVDLLVFSVPRLYGRFYPPGPVYVPPPAAQWLQDRMAAHREVGEGQYRFASAVYRARDTGEGSKLQDNRRLAYLPPNIPTIYAGLAAAQGYLAIRLTETGALFNAINDLGRNARVLSIYDPRSRLLDLLGVRYFVTDDVATFPSTVGGGRSLVATDPEATVLVREPLPAVELEVLSSLGDAVEVPDGEAVAEITLVAVDGREWTRIIRAGEHTAEWLYDAPNVAGSVRHRMAPVAHSQPRGDDSRAYVYRARLDLRPLGQPAVREFRLKAIHPRARWNVDRLILHTPFSSRFRLAHANGALRIWENPHALPRAWWTGAYVVEEETAGQFERLKDPAFDPARQAVLGRPLPDFPPAAPAPPGSHPARTQVIRLTANTRQYEVTAPEAGLLIVSETFAPGWRAWVDGRPVTIYRAVGGLQAVPVPAGTHQVDL